MVNVIITSAGRRVSLLRAFAEAVHPLGGKVVACDLDPLAPSLYEADAAERLPPIQDPGYIGALIDVVQRHEVRLVIPTIDPELAVLARHREQFLSVGCLPLVSTLEFVTIADDKWLTVRTFSRFGYRVPASWLPEHVESASLPEVLFVKPRRGSGSKDTYKVRREQLVHALELTPDPIIQECIDGAEFTVDALLDFQGRPLHYVIRQRLKVVGGESVEGVTVKSKVLEEYIPGLLSSIGDLGGRGPITLQLFIQETQPVLSEINPRFGGGFPLALEAGARYPSLIIDMLEGKSVEPSLGDYIAGIHMTRFYQEKFVSKPIWTR